MGILAGLVRTAPLIGDGHTPLNQQFVSGVGFGLPLTSVLASILLRSTEKRVSTTRVTMKRIVERSPRLKARVAGVFYLLAALIAAFAESLVRGWSLYASGLIPVACFVVVTLLLYQLFKPVNRSLALLAMLFNFVGLTFDALELYLWGVNIALIFHGLYCLLIGFLAFRSDFLPRFLAC